jgi:hypothetical protein
MSTHPTFQFSQLNATVRAAIGAALAVFVTAIGVLAIAVPAWAAHVAEYEQADHANDMFGDPVGWLLMFAVVVLAPLAVGSVSTVGASIALSHGSGGPTRGRVALFFVNTALSVLAMFVAGSIIPKGTPSVVSIAAWVVVLAAGAALGAVTGVIRPRSEATVVPVDPQ